MANRWHIRYWRRHWKLRWKMHVGHGESAIRIRVHLRNELPHKIHVNIGVWKMTILLIFSGETGRIFLLLQRIASALVLIDTLDRIYSLFYLFLSIIARSIIWFILGLCFYLNLLDFLLLFFRRKLIIPIGFLRHGLENDLCARFIAFFLLPQQSIARLLLFELKVPRIGGRRVLIRQFSLLNILIIGDTLHYINLSKGIHPLSYRFDQRPIIGICRSSESFPDELNHSLLLQLAQLLLVVATALVVGVKVGCAQRATNECQQALSWSKNTQKTLRIRTFSILKSPSSLSFWETRRCRSCSCRKDIYYSESFCCFWQLG